MPAEDPRRALHAAAPAVAPQWRPPRPRRAGTAVLEVLAVAVGMVGVVWALSLAMRLGGAASTAVAGALAFVPLVGVLATVAWVDRWEPEPRPVLAAALAWGAGVSTAVSLVLNDLIAVSVLTATGSATAAEVVGTVLGAPVVEELAKGAGVLLIFLARRRYFDGPVDGIVYAAVVAAGFAFTENVFYFVQYDEALSQVFFARAVQGPFAHVTFTACTGIALGLSSRSRGRGAWLALFPLGLAAAMGLHALWNGSAVLGVHGVVYWVVQVPLFVALVGLVVWLRADEKAVIAARLGEYARAGWFPAEEVAMLTSLRGRQRARSWAARAGRERAMRDFQAAATSLAFARQRAATGRRDLRASRDERELLDAVAHARGRLAAPPR
ncbi:PrsW family intramembrane metalloprotease [Georgenia sp. AZ-5]|uniref:PrsW family intramembrane metalloprotease n=1 Tax=Georgenia sp. AZ-5 TaxID=3367526 RepID=UPI0037547D94